MDEAASRAFFSEDFEKLKNVAAELSISRVESAGDRALTFRFRWKDRRYCVLIKGAQNYPLSPTDVRFVNPDNVTDDSTAHWPIGVNGINPTERFVCMAGTLEGHKKHNEWARDEGKNRLPGLAFRLVGLFGGGIQKDG